jgi:dihydrofolate reductase
MPSKRGEPARTQASSQRPVLTVVAAMSVSLDGFVAGAGDGPALPLGQGGERLFDWYRSGDTPSRHYAGRFHLSAISAQVFDQRCDRAAAVIAGRRTYDIANGWGGNGALPGVPLFVLTHRAPVSPPRAAIPYSFVTTGIASAIEQAQAGARAPGRNLMLMGGATIRAALAAGLLDEIELDLVPIMLGTGVPLFGGLAPVRLEVVRVIEAPGVTHLHYRVLRADGNTGRHA